MSWWSWRRPQRSPFIARERVGHHSIFGYGGDGRIAEYVFDGSRTYHSFPSGRYWVRAKTGDALTPEVEVVVGDEPAVATLTLP